MSAGPAIAELRRSAVIDVANALVTAALHRQLHARDDQLVHTALRELIAGIERTVALGVDQPLSLQCSDDRLFHDGQPLDGPSLQARSLLQRCRERQIAMLSFASGFTVDEANALFDLLLLPQNHTALARNHRDQALAAFGIRHVRITLRSPGDPGDRHASIEPGSRALHQYQALADCLQQNHLRAHRDLELAVDATASVVERTVQELDEPSLLLALAAQDDVDRFTVGHSVRVALLALQVARGLGANREQLVLVGAAALMHDIGKSKVPPEILYKQGPLSAEEWHWMAQHPRLGAQLLLEQHDHVDPRAIGAAFCHHMRPDGSGYPSPALPVAPCGTSRLVRVCDVFEALTSIRPYKRALAPIEAYAVMFRNAQDFDPAWLQRFTRTIGLFPTGTRVQLTDGAEAMVTAQTARPDRPMVRLLSGADGAALSAAQPDHFTIGDQVDGRTLQVLSVSMHDRCIAVPEFDPGEPQVLTQTVAGACLTSGLDGSGAPSPCRH